MKPRTFLIGIIAILTTAWTWDALVVNPVHGEFLWVLRQHGIYLSGMLAIGLMSVAVFLSTRPVYLEDFFGGMDKIFAAHKWSGMLAVLFGLAHWLIKLGGSPLKSLIGNVGKPTKDAPWLFMTPWKSLAKDLGEWALWILLALLVITLWKRFPYRNWRLLHKAMPILYLVLVFHTVALMPAVYWVGPVGLLSALLLIIGTVGSILAILQLIGRDQQHFGQVLSIENKGAGTLLVTCDAGPTWPGHIAGQFAFLRFDRVEGAHPFTIASAQKTGSSELTFAIKALGDYTTQLGHRLTPGQVVRIEGPYGRLDYRKGRCAARQIWIAGGIGVTPFLAWLQAMKEDGVHTPIEFHYSVQDASTDPFVQEVTHLCNALPNVTLRIHDARNKDRMSLQTLVDDPQNGKAMDLWFCGPSRFAQSLRDDIAALGLSETVFHQESFEMR